VPFVLTTTRPGQTRRAQALLLSRPVLLIAFAFSVMGDPVSSVAYAIEAALRALHGELALLLPTMGLVVGLVALIVFNYHALVGRFPEGGGAAAAAGSAFGEAWSFLPIGALIVDFCLTIAISVAAAASALIADLPGLAPARIPLAVGLLLLVGGLSWFGHGGRVLFAGMTLAFLAVAVVIIVHGFVDPALGAGPAITDKADHRPFFAVLLAFPVAMALSTGIEAPSSAIAQLGQLDNRGRRLFGRVTLWLTLIVVGSLTISLTILAQRLNVGIPHEHSTQIADIARRAVGSGLLFSLFQWTSALLLLAAASSSFQAGPGLLKALTTHGGVLPAPLGRTNQFHTPYIGVALFVLVSGTILVAAGAEDQELVLFYAVAVFISFLAGLLAMGAFAHREGNRWLVLINAGGALLVGFVLSLNLIRGYPVVSLAATLLIAGLLYLLWVRAGRPRGMTTLETAAGDLFEVKEAREPRG
jgi:hypothetical protein